MISIQKASLKLIFLGAIGGWLGGACVNVSDVILDGLVHVNAFKSGLVGAVSNIILAMPWIFGINYIEKQSAQREKPVLRWLSDIIGGCFGIVSSVFAVSLFFLFWPYEAHGRVEAYKTVMAIVGTNPGSLFGIGGLVGVYASSWIRPTQEKLFWLMDILLPLAILGGLVGIVSSNIKSAAEPVAVEMSEEEKECCGLAYQAFVEKVGVSYAIFEAEKYCEISCPVVSDCVDQCSTAREACGTELRECKDAYRACVLTCPNLEAK